MFSIVILYLRNWLWSNYLYVILHFADTNFILYHIHHKCHQETNNKLITTNVSKKTNFYSFRFVVILEGNTMIYLLYILQIWTKILSTYDGDSKIQEPTVRPPPPHHPKKAWAFQALFFKTNAVLNFWIMYNMS